MNTVSFSCTRCGQCCRASIPLGLAEALEYDDRFLLSLVVSVETWDLGDFSKNRPAVPITQDELFTALAFRKDKLARDASRDLVFRSGRVPGCGGRIATFLSVSACGLGDWNAGAARCPALGQDGLCSAYEARPLGCRVFPLDPMYPEMLQHVPLGALTSRLACDFSAQAPALWTQGRLVSGQARELLAARQETLATDSLFLPYYAAAAHHFPPMPELGGIIAALKGNGRMDLPFVPVLVYLAAAGQVSVERAEQCLERQRDMFAKAAHRALEAKDKAQRARTAVLRNCLALMESFAGRLKEAVDR